MTSGPRPRRTKMLAKDLWSLNRPKGGEIRCRHAISLDTGHGASRSEVSVVRAKFIMLVESIKETLENQIIGQIIADGNSPIIVRSTIVGVLSALQSAGDLVDFLQRLGFRSHRSNQQRSQQASRTDRHLHSTTSTSYSLSTYRARPVTSCRKFTQAKRPMGTV